MLLVPYADMLNHSNNANCAKMKDLLTNFYHLIATRDIEMGEELTVTYTLYKIDNGD